MITHGIKTQAKSTGIIPEGHYGGRSQRLTEDALTRTTTWDIEQWSKGQFGGVPFVEFKDAFVTVNPTLLANTLWQRGFLEALISLITAYLSRRTATTAFEDFGFMPKDWKICLSHGPPLMIILYIIYKLSLLTQAEKMPDFPSIGSVDEIALLTAQWSLDAVRR